MSHESDPIHKLSPQQELYKTTVTAYIEKGFTALDLSDNNGRQEALERYGPRLGVIMYYQKRLPQSSNFDQFRDVWSQASEEKQF